MTPVSTAPVTVPRSHPPAIDDIPIQEQLFDVSNVSTPSMIGGSRLARETSSDVGTFHPNETPKKIADIKSILYANATQKTQAKT